ncbi:MULTISPECIES: hypothetical protein [Bacillus]|uniref:Uncharacterized protein n=1 Tax=Bacillus capparidis TaxID=1840411 RepID=A0ABS4D0T5_9BACI|nr:MULTISPECIES: hypothetical protein [Bacillus]MBP1083241.1 hypothetical protein [Bacillus capparidis]MED1097679.1 hypothetical protein [Bacillus capparidis]
MNKLILIIGLALFLLGIYISEWTLFGVVIGIAGGFLMGLSSLIFGFKRK